MKKIIVIIVSIVFAIIMFLVFVNADNHDLTNEEALKIGEEKYLDFIWMVDGAFNNEKLKEEITVNGKSAKNKEFTCTYKKKSNICISKNFLSSFNKLFVKRLRPENVYGDGISFSWITKIKDGYEFNNVSNCSIKRMSLNQLLKVQSIEKNKIEYIVSFDNGEVDQLFVLEKEDNNWKISKAYYYDLCKLDYSIE